MKRLLSILVLLLLATALVSTTANAGTDNCRHAIVHAANGMPIGMLVVCPNPAGGFTATLFRPDGTVLCGPSPVFRAPNGELGFQYNNFRFFFGCVARGCFWHAGQRHGALTRA
ncbi:MAG: hypothetical protein HY292_21150 [Planctomycetes bacterium]|nr:hypothetical protein [Planctomycetota bacterium]